jgi:hypothetical protein
MDIVRVIRKCDSWSTVKDDGNKFGRYFVQVHFDDEADAMAFAVELMMITSGQEPYSEIPGGPSISNGPRETP